MDPRSVLNELFKAAVAAARAGQVIRGDENARVAGFNPDKALAANDSAPYFTTRGGLVNCGPTFTNVNDFREVPIPEG